MSELINSHDNRATIRWKLLASASALALASYCSSADVAKAEDTSQPLIWIELGGQMENISGQGEVFAPGFIAANPGSPVLNSVTPLQAQKPPRLSFGEEAKLSYQPENSDWLFSAAIRFGRFGNSRHIHHQTTDRHQELYNGVPYGSILTQADFADTKSDQSEQNTIVDFSVGKDVGLGLFGSGSSSTLSAGVRFAQFTSKLTVDMRARPDLHVKYFTYGPRVIPLLYCYTYHATGHASRQFNGVGPSISWNGSAPFAGNDHDGELNFDWSANASLLFGKQRANVLHHETTHYEPKLHEFGAPYYLVNPHPSGGHIADRSVTVPNVGGSIGLSWRVQNFKASLGYRADFFFGAMDTGIDAVRKSNLTFNGPYASISIGIGD